MFARIKELAQATILLSLVTLTPLTARHQIDVPIYAGGEPEMDACPGTGDIMGLNPRGDGFLSVRSGPGGRPFREIDRLYNGQRVHICEERGAWMGVVYDKSGADTSGCQVRRPWPVRQPYTGPCRYGWVHSRYVGNLAG
jgi:hypothetical protein